MNWLQESLPQLFLIKAVVCSHRSIFIRGIAFEYLFSRELYEGVKFDYCSHPLVNHFPSDTSEIFPCINF